MRNLFLLGSLVAVIGLAGCGGATSSSGRGNVRAIDAYSDSSIDVSTDLDQIGFGMQVGNVTNYASIGTGATDIIVLNAGTNTVLGTRSITVEQGRHYTEIPYRTAGGGGTVEVASFIDDTAIPGVNEWKLRFIHMDRTQAQNLDVYVTTPLADINTATPVLTDVAFVNAAGYITLPTTGNNTLLRVTIAGTKTIVGNGVTINPISGEIKTLIALEDGGHENLIYDDFNN